MDVHISDPGADGAQDLPELIGGDPLAGGARADVRRGDDAE